MKNFRSTVRGASLLASTGIAFSTLAATGEQLDVSVGGFIRADYGVGDRYPVSSGGDRLGISKAALSVTAQQDDIKGVFVVGGQALTDGDPNNNGNVGIKDAFIVVGAGKTQGFWFSVGAQALLYGLKPNGYPGDRSLQPSIEYGGAGGFAVSQQAGPSIVGTYAFTPNESLRFGAFDLNSSNAHAAPTNGSKLTNNFFLLWRGANLFDTGLYATAGAESIYVGGTVDTSRVLASAGIGYKQGIFDASIEYVHLDKDIVARPDDERYIIAEFTVQPIPDWTFYADYSNGHEIDAKTYRIGANYQWRKHLAFSVEGSKDDVRAGNVQSLDLRLR